MAGRNEKNPERNVLLVDASRLGQGIKTLFLGVAMVFGSLGLEETVGEIGAAGELAGVKAGKNLAAEGKENGVAETAGNPSAKAGTQETAVETPSAAGDSTVQVSTADDSTVEASTEGVSASDVSVADATREDGKPGGGNAPDSVPAGTKKSAVTVDDITKVIVAKIKQKRSNNAKIGALLKTYGVEKVSSLPEEKYEAFLTDISQL